MACLDMATDAVHYMHLQHARHAPLNMRLKVGKIMSCGGCGMSGFAAVDIQRGSATIRYDVWLKGWGEEWKVYNGYPHVYTPADWTIGRPASIRKVETV